MIISNGRWNEVHDLILLGMIQLLLFSSGEQAAHSAGWFQRPAPKQSESSYVRVLRENPSRPTFAIGVPYEKRKRNVRSRRLRNDSSQSTSARYRRIWIYSGKIQVHQSIAGRSVLR